MGSGSGVSVVVSVVAKKKKWSAAVLSRHYSGNVARKSLLCVRRNMTLMDVLGLAQITS